MPYFFLDIELNPTGTVTINGSPHGFQRLRIISYQVSGLTSIQPLFLSILNQPVSHLWGNPNASIGYPLGFNDFPSSFVQLSRPLVICDGDNLWNDAKTIEYKVTDWSGQPAIFTRLYVLFEFDEPDHHFSESRKNPGTKVEEVLQRVARNTDPLPDFYKKGSAGSYPRYHNVHDSSHSWVDDL